MKNRKPAEMSDAELLRAEKSAKTLTYMFGIILFLLFAINIYLVFKKGFTASTAVPIALLPILIVNLNWLNEMKKEKKNRNLG